LRHPPVQREWGIIVSLLSGSRPSAQHRRSSHDDKQPTVTLSPWHLLALGLVALLGTGILAAIDRSQERASSHMRVRAQPGKSEAQTARAAAHVSLSSDVATPRAPVQADSLIRSETAPASEPGRSDRSLFVAPAQAAAAEPPPVTPAIASTETEAKANPSLAEGPIATASLAPALPMQPSGTGGLQGAVTRGALKTSAAAPTECLPNELRAVLADVAARFGTITVVSTHQLTTGNHSAGSIREKLHHDCKAVDIRPERGRIDEIKRYLSGRREIVGVESYRNGIIHMDVSGGVVASARPQGRSARRRAPEAAIDALQAPGAPPPAVQTPAPAPTFDGSN
jgi:uncharacterized protein YcbK (DUF882 family)